LYEGPWVSERYTALEDFLKAQPEAFFPATLKITSGGADHSARDAFAAQYKLAELRRESEAVWEGLAAIVTPTAGGFPKLSDLETDPIGPNSQLGYYTNFMNLLDLCAVAVPAGKSAEGLPFGVTWIAPRDCDKALITAADSGPTHALASEHATNTLSILLFGAHMKGLPLNMQVQALGGRFIGEVQTAPKYKMIYLPEPAPHRPGIIRVGEGGKSIGAEEWALPKASLGELLSTINQPLGLGQLELSDGRKVHGFVCEAKAGEGAKDISASGSWRGFLK
jgi:allophanate hydrolase